MNDNDINAVLDRLVRLPESEVGDWDDVMARSPDATKSTPSSNRRRWLSPRRALAFAAPAMVVALIALTVTSPWKGGPTILERAAAAVPTPTASQILYENVVVRFGRSAGSARSPVHLQVWLAGTAPHRFRILLHGASLPNTVEVGATIGSTEVLSYSSAFGVLDPVPFQGRVAQADLNPAAFIRAAVTAGTARPDGTATVAGRHLIRILVTSRLFGRPVGTTLYLVDPYTYEPIRVIVSALVPNGAAIGFPMANLIAFPYGAFPEPSKPYVLVFDFTKFQYLSPTAANSGLTNIQTQHPAAKIA